MHQPWTGVYTFGMDDVRERARMRLAWLLFCSQQGEAAAADGNPPADWLVNDPSRRDALLADADAMIDLIEA